MRAIMKVCVLLLGGLVILSGCSALSALLPGDAEPTAEAVPTVPEPTAVAAASGFIFYNSFATW